MDKGKLVKLEKYTLYAAFAPLLALFIVGLFFRSMPNMKLYLEIDLALVGLMLFISSLILPEVRLWDKIKRDRRLIIQTVLMMVIYVAAYSYFYYSYAITYAPGTARSNTPIIIMLAIVAYQRFNPTDKIVEKFVNSHLDLYPEDKARFDELKRQKEEQEAEEARQLAEIERLEAEKREEIPDFEEFFELRSDKSNK